MKKIFLFVLVAFLFASTVQAASYANFQDGEIKQAVLTCGTTEAFSIGLSPKVAASYTENGAGNAPQWYMIMAVHIGGNKGYATAQNFPNIFEHAYSPGNDTPATLFSNLATDPSSEDEWKANGWTY